MKCRLSLYLVALLPLVLLIPSTSALDGETIKSLTYIPLATEKVEQIIGEIDKQHNTPTRNKTISRYRLIGTDLGMSFEHDDKCWFLFGDCIGPGGGDAIGFTTAINTEKQGLPLDFLTRNNGEYYRIEPPGSKTGGFEVSAGGVSIGGTMYILFKTDYDRENKNWITKLYRFDPLKKRYTYIRDWEQRNGPLGKCTLRIADGKKLGLHNGPVVLIWGCGEQYRQSNVFHGWAPVKNFEKEPVRYFIGMVDGKPAYAEDRSKALPIVKHPVVGDVSVAYVEQLGIYIMIYGSRKAGADENGQKIRGLIFRWSRTPWGSWGAGQTIYQSRREKGYGHFIHDAKKDDGLVGPVIGLGNSGEDPKTVYGGTYAPYIIDRFLAVKKEELHVYFVLSTWNPYTVVLMHTCFKVNGEDLMPGGNVQD